MLLLTLLFVAEAELETRAVNTICQMCIMILSVSIFFIISIHVKNSKIIAFFIAVVLWLVLVHAKNRYLPKNTI